MIVHFEQYDEVIQENKEMLIKADKHINIELKRIKDEYIQSRLKELYQTIKTIEESYEI